MRLRAAAIIIGCAIIVGFIISVPRARDGVRPPAAEKKAAVSVPPIALKDVYKKGTHTITGSLVAPNACTTVSAAAELANDAAPESILVAVTLTPSEGVCLQLPTKLTFTTSVAAPADVPLTATVNGTVATTTML